MPLTRTQMFLEAKKVMRIHPGWSRQEVGEYCGVPRPAWPDVLDVARRELLTTESVEGLDRWPDA